MRASAVEEVTVDTECDDQTVDPECDAEAWAALVVANTRANSGELTVSDIESAIQHGKDDLIAVSWARSHDDIEFADKSRTWARQRRIQSDDEVSAGHAQFLYSLGSIFE